MSFTYTWFGHGTFGLETGGYKVVIDPYFTDNPAASTTANDVEADFIVVSHGHGDHIADAIDIARRTGAQVIANFEIVNWLAAQGVENGHPQHIGGGFDYPWGRVKLTIAHHGSALPDGSYGGNPCGFLFSIQGKNIYHACDTGLFFDMKLIGEAGIDLAVDFHLRSGPVSPRTLGKDGRLQYPDHRSFRKWKGTGGPGGARSESAQDCRLRHRQLRRHTRKPDRIGAVRPREGRLHRRGQRPHRDVGVAGDPDARIARFDHVGLDRIHSRQLGIGAERGHQSCQVTRGGARYDLSGISMINSIANLVDSLLVIKKLIFEERRIDFKTLLEAVGNDFRGHEDLLQEIRNLSGKWGNGDPETDEMAARVMKGLLKKEMESFSSTSGQTAPERSPGLLLKAGSAVFHARWCRRSAATRP